MLSSARRGWPMASVRYRSESYSCSVPPPFADMFRLLLLLLEQKRVSVYNQVSFYRQGSGMTASRFLKEVSRECREHPDRVAYFTSRGGVSDSLTYGELDR